MKGDQITKTNLKPSSSIMLLLGLLLATACSNSNTIYNSHTAIANEGWESYTSKDFTIAVPAQDHYDINLFLRHSSIYQYSNLWLFVDYISPDSAITTDTINVTLADAYGNWKGNSWGSAHQIEQNIAHKLPLDSGIYTIKLSQAIREHKLKGISNIGLSVTKSEE